MRTETAIRTAAQIRQEFIDFFAERCGHTFVPSSPVVPHDDPTLLFTNAGMNQFKDVFLGHGDRGWTRAVNTQKCIRAGGKHNDLEDVGKDTYHHTFFEMLGNWSFGDYFKAEAIEWAWQLLTDVWGLDKDRLYVTVFAGDTSEKLEPDDDAAEIWRKFVPADRIGRWGKKDNFWEMGETGPCGPCSEIHYDSRPDDERARLDGSELVNRDHPDVIEVWNLVFIQFNRSEKGLSTLPAKHVDTGMGLERLVRVLQNKRSNYDTDIWTPVFSAIREKTGAPAYGGKLDDPVDVAYRVLADHIRCLTVAITDGARPGNEGRGYVLRRILRRAVRHAHQTLGVQGPVLCELVQSVVDSLGDAFPELKKKRKHVEDVIHDEEESFLRTIDNGIKTWWSFAGYALQQQFVKEQVASGKPGDQVPYISISEAGSRRDFEFHRETQILPWTPNSTVIVTKKDFDTSPENIRFKFKLGALTTELVRELCKQPPAINAEGAFMLHDTYGFPIDLTRVMAQERGMTVDEDGFEKLMDEARERSRSAGETEERIELPPDAIARLKHMNVKPTLDADKYHGRPLTAEIRAIWNGEDFDEEARIGRHVAVILDRTNHYAEAGGQIGDSGEIRRGSEDIGRLPVRGHMLRAGESDFHFKVESTQSYGGYVLHIGHVTEGEPKVGDRVEVHVDQDRRQPTRAHHTATHLMNHALRAVVGADVDQKGSLVAPDRLRFDFTCSHALKAEQIQRVEDLVNETILRNLEVHADDVSLELAKQIHGVRAVFGERYPDPVRVVSIGAPIVELVKNPADTKWHDFSIEFCGGTHLTTTQEAKRFVIVHEQALAAGVRRILALTGAAAMAADAAGRELEQRASRAAGIDDDDSFTAEIDELNQLAEALTMSAAVKHRVLVAIEALRDRIRQIRKTKQSEGRAFVLEQARQQLDEATGPIVINELQAADKETLLNAMDVFRSNRSDAAVMLFSGDPEENRVLIAATVPPDLIKRGLKAGDWVREAAKVCGGGGGGRPDLAQAGGKDPSKIDDAISAARAFAEKKLA